MGYMEKWISKLEVTLNFLFYLAPVFTFRAFIPRSTQTLAVSWVTISIIQTITFLGAVVTIETNATYFFTMQTNKSYKNKYIIHPVKLVFFISENFINIFLIMASCRRWKGIYYGLTYTCNHFLGPQEFMNCI